MPLRNKLKQYMQANGFRQQQVADCLGTSRQAVSQMCRQPPRLGARKLADLCDVFQCEPGELLERIKDVPPSG